MNPKETQTPTINQQMLNSFAWANFFDLIRNRHMFGIERLRLEEDEFNVVWEEEHPSYESSDDEEFTEYESETEYTLSEWEDDEDC